MRKTICGRSFDVVDPATYPHGQGCFDEEEPIHADWCAYGPGDFLIDVGACFGAFTLPALTAGAKVFAFEPSDDGSRILQANVRLNGESTLARCAIFNFAMFDGGAYPTALHDDVFGRSYPAANVKYTTLDTIFSETLEELPGAIRAIKIDVEGGELGVLLGATRMLASRPDLYIEDHDGINRNAGCIVSDYPESIHSRETILKILTELGYRVEQRPWGCNRNYIVAKAA